MNEIPPEPPYVPTLPNLLRHAAAAYGGSELIVRGGARLTFAQLEARSCRLAKGLVASGIGKGAHVGVLLPNGPDFAIAFMAAARIGAVVLPMSTLYQARELAWVLNHADIESLVVAPGYLGHDYLARLEEALPQLAGQARRPLVLAAAPALRRVFVWSSEPRTLPAWCDAAPAALQAAAAGDARIDDTLIRVLEAAVTPADPAFMIYTSGSTADPKGVLHTHGNSMRHSFQMATVYGLPRAGERVLSPRPFFWIAGLSATLFYALQAGFCIVVPESADPVALLDLIEAEKIDFVTGTAASFDAINRTYFANSASQSVVQIVTDYAGVTDSGSPPRFVCQRLEDLIPAAEALATRDRMPSIYGMTETTSAYVSVPAPARVPPAKRGANGRPAPGSFVRIVDPESGEPLPAGSPGELLVGGYSLMAGLYKKEYHETFIGERWYATGDMCSLDEDGWVRFVTRLGDMVKVSGANVAPLEVEQLLNAEETVRESAVFGIEEGGRTILVAVVIAHEGQAIDEAALRERLSGQLSSFKVPRRIVAMIDAEVPRTATGKIQKRALRAVLAARNDRA